MRRVVFLLLLVSCAAKVQSPPAPIRDIVVLGDSLAHGAGDESGRGIAGALAAMTHARVENLGINGARTANVLQHLARADVRAAVQRAQLIVVSVGGNDLFGSSLERVRSMIAPRIMSSIVASRVARVISRIHRENPAAQIVLLGLYDPYHSPFLDKQIARWDGRMITRFADWHAVNVVRIADLIDTAGALSPIDHYHPSAAGYRAIAARIWGAYTRSSA